MASLGSLLLDAHLATLRQVEDATYRQMLYGDDLTTHLLDLGLGESALVRGLAKAHEVEPLDAGELPRASQEALERIPLAVAERYRLYPLALRDGVLEVVVSEPWPDTIRDELSTKLGLSLRFRFASLPRIRQALARDYGAPLPPHLERLLEVLDANLPVKSPPPIVTTLKPGAVPPPPVTLKPVVIVTKPETPAPTETADDEASASPRKPKRFGPITPALAKEALEDAMNRDEVLTAFFDFARQFFEHAALFTIQRTAAEVFAVFGLDDAPGTPVPLDSSGKLSEAKTRKLPLAVTLSKEGEDRKLAESLGRETDVAALLLPIVVRDRTVAILYGDHGDEAVDLADVGEVIALAPLCGQALERIILRKKLGRA